MRRINPEFIEKLLEVDIEIANTAFRISTEVGVAAVKNCVSEFRNLLVREIGPFINGMNMEYRSYVIGLLIGIRDEYKPDATKALVFPDRRREKTTKTKHKGG